MKKTLLIISCLALGLFGIYQLGAVVLAVEPRPDGGASSDSDSRLKVAYDWLVSKGDNYGANDASDWDSASTYAWGTYWNRIMEAAAWEPDGNATAGDVPSGFTFYSGSGDRAQKTGTMFELQANMAYDDWNCSGNNEENTSACSAGDSEYTGEEGTWALTSSGGTAASVTDNSVTVSLISNKVYRDNWTKLYWTDRTSSDVDNEFSYVDGDDRVNPTGASCNFNSTGTANQYCDNQDPLNAYTEDNDVSAAEFCLNLSLDADGDATPETDWRLPTQKELMQAHINGAANNLPSAAAYHWSSTEHYSSQSYAWHVSLSYGYTNYLPKDFMSRYARCVRRD